MGMRVETQVSRFGLEWVKSLIAPEGMFTAAAMI